MDTSTLPWEEVVRNMADKCADEGFRLLAVAVPSVWIGQKKFGWGKLETSHGQVHVFDGGHHLDCLRFLVNR
jgi:hypothetical protein